MFNKKYVVDNSNPIPSWNLVLSWVSRTTRSSLVRTKVKFIDRHTLNLKNGKRGHLGNNSIHQRTFRRNSN